MNEQGLKALENLGAELGAAKAENERLRGLLRECAGQIKADIHAALSRQAEQHGSVYIECRQCDECNHGGINDSASGLASCHDCDWKGPEPAEDKCPGCQSENCMAAACPECGARYVLVASEYIAALPQQAEPKFSICNDVGIIGHSDICPECADTWVPPEDRAEQAPAQDEREAFEAEARKLLYVLDRETISGEYIVPDTENAWQLWQARATRPAQTEQQPVALPPFAAQVLEKLERVDECFSDGQGADIGREWFDVLTLLGLLKREQRSPALWSITQQGRDALAAPIAQTAPQPEQSGLVESALRKAVAYLDENPFNEIASGSILHRVMGAALSAQGAGDADS